MKQLSRQFRDRPMPPIDLAVWAVEYTARQPKGSLESPIRHQSWVTRTLIDVYALLFFSLVVVLFIVFSTLKILFNLFYRHTYTATKLHKNKQQ